LDGATAGILGHTAVTVTVEGLPLAGAPGNIVLGGLPFQGSVRIRKKGLLRFDSGDEDDGKDKEGEVEKTWKEILRRIREKLPF